MTRDSELIARLRKFADGVDLIDGGSAYTISMRRETRAILNEAASRLEAIGEPVGANTDAEWELEQRAFDAANHSDVPEWAQKTVADLWKRYCLATEASPTPSDHVAVPVEPTEGPRIKPQIIQDLREWAEFEQDGGNVEQGAAIDIILDWYDRQTGLDTSRSRAMLAALPHQGETKP